MIAQISRKQTADWSRLHFTAPFRSPYCLMATESHLALLGEMKGQIYDWAQLFVYAVVLLLSQPCNSESKECEVCISVLERVDATLQGSAKKDKPKIEAAIDKYCSRKDIDSKDKKMCYYLEPIKREVSQPFSTGMPKLKVCERLKKKNAEICSIKYPVKTDDQTDYSKLKVKELKAILAQRGVECTGCLEKPDFVKKCEETKHIEL